MAKTILVNDVLGKCCVCRQPSTVRYRMDTYERHFDWFEAYCDEHRELADPRLRVIYDEHSTGKKP